MAKKEFDRGLDVEIKATSLSRRNDPYSHSNSSEKDDIVLNARMRKRMEARENAFKSTGREPRINCRECWKCSACCKFSQATAFLRGCCMWLCRIPGRNRSQTSLNDKIDIGEQLRDLTVRHVFLHPFASLEQLNMRTPLALLDCHSKVLGLPNDWRNSLVYSDDETIFEDSILYAGAFEIPTRDCWKQLYNSMVTMTNIEILPDTIANSTSSLLWGDETCPNIEIVSTPSAEHEHSGQKAISSKTIKASTPSSELMRKPKFQIQLRQSSVPNKSKNHNAFQSKANYIALCSTELPENSEEDDITEPGKSSVKVPKKYGRPHSARSSHSKTSTNLVAGCVARHSSAKRIRKQTYDRKSPIAGAAPELILDNLLLPDSMGHFHFSVPGASRAQSLTVNPQSHLESPKYNPIMPNFVPPMKYSASVKNTRRKVPILGSRPRSWSQELAPERQSKVSRRKKARSILFKSAKKLTEEAPSKSVFSVFSVMDPEAKVDPEFVEKCHAFVLEKKLYIPPVSVDEFLETRVERCDDYATRTIKAWAYLSCWPPMHTTDRMTQPKELDLHPGVLVRLLGTSEKNDPLTLYSAWDVCSKGLLHFYRSRFSESNCKYHLYQVWKEIMTMGPEFSVKLLNLLALGNHPSYNIYEVGLSPHGDFFKGALNIFAMNPLYGAKIGREAVVLADRKIRNSKKIISLKEVHLSKTFTHLVDLERRRDSSFDIEGYELYDQAKLLSPCIFNYFREYISKVGGVVLFRPRRLHSRPFYENLLDKVSEESRDSVSCFSTQLLITNWLSGVFYFRNASSISKMLDILNQDPNVEVVSIKNQMKSKSLFIVTLILNNLEEIGKPSKSVFSSFFLELRLQYIWTWYFKRETFRLEQMAICEPEHLLASRRILKREFLARECDVEKD